MLVLRITVGVEPHPITSHSSISGTIPALLRPLADALRVANPRSLLTWLRVSQSCQLLTQLLAQKTDITHDALDTLPQGTATRHIREILVSAELLGRRNEDLAQLQLWAERIIATLPASQQRIVRPFAEWQIIRKARRIAARGIYREAAARRDRAQINAAIVFLNWLDTHHTPVGELTQHHVDAWFDTHRAKHRPVVAFLRWLSARGIITTVEIPTRDQGLPQHFLDLDTHSQQLRRCLTDDTLPLEVRVAGALVRLYGMPLAAIVELTADRFTRDETDAYLLFDTHPILLPPTLARLIEQMSRARRRRITHPNRRPPELPVPRTTTNPATQPLRTATRPHPPRTAAPRRPQHRHDHHRRRHPGHRGQRPPRNQPRHR
ncbi:hypothetical protein [Nocardia abscessus]|uniref:hypothetical protein n=1 Tax=Nocardia abscessus TaxID=120957 RepID=UPI002456981C|nr:hypothetical protein [Nocardia abscessus]